MATNLLKIIGQFFGTKEQFLQGFIPIPYQSALNASNTQFVCQWSLGRFPPVRLHRGACQFEVRSQITIDFVLCVCMRARVFVVLRLYANWRTLCSHMRTPIHATFRGRSLVLSDWAE